MNDNIIASTGTNKKATHQTKNAHSIMLNNGNMKKVFRNLSRIIF